MTKRRRRLTSARAIWVTAGLCGSALWLFEARPAHADVLGSIGNFLGKPLGGFLNSASAPTIANVEGTADRFVANVDTRVNADMDHAG